MRTGNKFILILSALLVWVTLLAAPQQADAAELKKLVFSMKQVYIQTNGSGSLDSIGLRVLAIMDNGLEQDVTDDPECKLTSSKETIFTVSGQTVTAVAKGSAALKAAYGGKTANLTVKVIDTVKPQLILSADSPTLQTGGSLSVKAKLEFNDSAIKPLDVTNYCTWTSDDDDIVSVKAGKLKALALSETGIGIHAECVMLGASISENITVKVINPIKSLKAEPFSITGTTGGTFTDLAIKPVYKDGSSGSSVTSGAQFSSTNTKVAKVGNTDSDKGQVNFVAAGKASIKAAYAGKTVSIPVRVVDTGSVTSLVPIPDQPLQIEAGKSSSIKFKDNNGAYVTSYVNLSSDNETVATTSTGRINALSPGVANIECSYGGLETTINVTVIKKVSSLAVSPASINIAMDQTAQLVLTATYSDKTTSQVTESGTYTSGDSDIAKVDENGIVTGGTGAGSTKITASFGGKTVTVPVNVIEANFSHITFSTSSTSGGPTPPEDINDITYNLATGNSLKVYARALFSGAHSTPVTDITSQCVWTSDDASVATVSGGSVSAKKAGATRITATYGNRSNSFTVNVWPTISSITATPNTLGFFGSADTPKSITSIIAKFSDGSERDLEPSEITWVSKDEDMVTVSNGTVTLNPAFKTGSTTVTGTLAGKTFTVDVTVSPEITDFSLSTGSITLITGTAATFNVTAQYFGGTYSDVTKICDYTVKDEGGTVTSKVTMDKDKGTITAQAGAPVTGTIDVTLDGTTKSMDYKVIPTPTALGVELNPGTVFDPEYVIDNNQTSYFNIANPSTYNVFVHSTANPTDDSTRISSGSLMSVFSNNNDIVKIAEVENSGLTYYTLTNMDNSKSAAITVYFLDKSFKFTMATDLSAPLTPEEDLTAAPKKEGTTQSKNFNIIVKAEAGSSVSAIVAGTGSVLTNNAESVTATTAGTATLPIDILKLPNEGANNAIDITVTDQAGNPSPMLTVNVTKDTTKPTITVGATSVHGGGDTITVQFSEEPKNDTGQVTKLTNWILQYANDTTDTGLATLSVTNAVYNYDSGTRTLTITLNEAADQAFIPNGKYVKVTPNSTNISDLHGNAGVTADYSGQVTAESGKPAVAIGWAKNDLRTFTITYSEVLDRDLATNKNNWSFSGGTTISAVTLDADSTKVTVTLNADIQSGNTLAPTANIKDLAGNSVIATTYTE